MRRIKTKRLRKQQRLSEWEEIELLEEWIDDQKPDCGTNPLAIPPPSPSVPVGRAPDGCFSPYAGCKLFQHLPISRNTKQGLVPKYKEMSEIQRASLPHSLCGRDILGAAKTGSGKTLAFIIPVIEKLYRARWGPEDGVGSIIISPTKELAGQLFEELKLVGKYHSLSAGLLIGGRKDVDAEKERVNFLNILVCTPGRLLQHMNETPNFDCSQLQVLVLDEADRMLDKKFKGELDAIISQLPKQRQTLLFSATQTKSVNDLARLSLKDPEFISVHAESVTATPEHLKQVAMEVPLDKKMNLLWSFIRCHLQSKMIVFLSTCKQVQFVYEAFKKLRPGIPLRCLHGNMKRNARMAMYLDFCETTSVLFATDLASRGLDFPTVDWVIQVDCPEDVSAYIHRVGRTARYYSEGKSVLFLLPSEREMLIKLQSAKPKIPIQMRKVKSEKLEEISGSLASVLVKYPELLGKAKRAIITYVKSIDLYKDKEVFDVSKLPLKEYSASLGLPVVPKIRFRSQKKNSSKGTGEVVNQHIDMELKDERFYNTGELKKDEIDDGNRKKPAVEMLQWNNKNEKAAEESEDEFLVLKRSPVKLDENGPTDLPTRILKKKLKINVLRPLGNKVKYDEDGNQINLPAFAIPESAARATDPEKAMASYYERVLEKMAQQDKEDKVLQRQGLREKRVKKKIKLKRSMEEEGNEDDGKWKSEDGEKDPAKSKKIRFESDEDSEHDVRKAKKMKSFDADAISLAEQESLALKLLSSMHP